MNKNIVYKKMTDAFDIIKQTFPDYILDQAFGGNACLVRINACSIDYLVAFEDNGKYVSLCTHDIIETENQNYYKSLLQLLHVGEVYDIYNLELIEVINSTKIQLNINWTAPEIPENERQIQHMVNMFYRNAICQGVYLSIGELDNDYDCTQAQTDANRLCIYKIGPNLFDYKTFLEPYLPAFVQVVENTYYIINIYNKYICTDIPRVSIGETYVFNYAYWLDDIQTYNYNLALFKKITHGKIPINMVWQTQMIL